MSAHQSPIPARWGAALVVAVVFASGAAPLGAQSDSPVHGAAVTRGDAGWLTAGTVGSVLLMSTDARLTREALRSPVQHGGFVRSALDAGREFGGPGALVLGAGLWGVGRLTHERTPERIGLRAMEAILVSGAATSVIKGLAGRARPDYSPGDPHDFAFARGIRESEGFDSYPSGHATVAFALASAVDAEWGRLSPRRPRWVGPALYALATLTAASRVFDNRHWTSDVVLGSVIGVVGGHAVVRWHADSP